MMEDILTTIKNEIKEFETKTIEIVPGYDFNQKKTLERIYLYYNSKFETGEFDDQGDKKYFFNIVRAPCNVGTKAIDFDTKDINILTAEGGDPAITWYFERDFKFWMKDKKFGKVLNRIFYELPIFGSVVLKIVNGKPYFVDLRNFIVEQNADSLDKANYIIEKHNYTSVEFKKLAKERKWRRVEEVLSEFRKIYPKEPYIKVYERYGEVEIKEGEFVYERVISAEVNKKQFILDEKPVDKLPYWEFHWEKIPGRWLGKGRVEILFDNQIRVNEVSNQEVKSSYWSTLRLWQTRDEGVPKNLLTDVDHGEVLNVNSEIMQVDMADRNLAYYDQEIQRWLVNRDEQTFAHEALRGERLPAGTPLGSAQLAVGMAGAYFDQIRENVAMDIKQFIFEILIPQFEKENTKEHVLRIAGEDLDKINNLIINLETTDAAIRQIERTGRFPTRAEIELLRGIVVEKNKKAKEKLITIPKDFYKGIKFKIDIEITGEAIDTRVKAANLWIALQAVIADPTLLTDPVKKKFFGRWLEQGKLNLIDFETETPLGLSETIEKVEAGKRAGGGISRPVIPAIPVAGTTEERL